ncbi:MAG: hypothetical protein A2Y20_04075 [Firmicutes bacterium GWF2_51_9]|nr:MAG: hypothetical protein A2Y20_04075 [Firmicutes bacterium GWF2_51_9]OGS59606.1 MAG: hypothetical protein A2Y19_01655 [Firmicutes bacterium GWE2_51_13]HBZ41630.1 hypothetical protein [Erysipelotrichaceae bacterium]
MTSQIIDGKVLLSFPIPFDKNETKYSELKYKGKNYFQIVKELKPTFNFEKCHLDPDIYDNILEKRPDDWEACFGQEEAALTHLMNQKVKVGDVFLFFGWFIEVENVGSGYKYKRGASDKHVIFGYFQISGIHDTSDEIAKYHWHPHSTTRPSKPNAIFTALEFLLDTKLPGYGTFTYSEDLDLTRKGYSRSKWELPDCIKCKTISYHNEFSQKKDYFQSAMIGQEFVLDADQNIAQWLIDKVKKHRTND